MMTYIVWGILVIAIAFGVDALFSFTDKQEVRDNADGFK